MATCGVAVQTGLGRLETCFGRERVLHATTSSVRVWHAARKKEVQRRGRSLLIRKQKVDDICEGAGAPPNRWAVSSLLPWHLQLYPVRINPEEMIELTVRTRELEELRQLHFIFCRWLLAVLSCGGAPSCRES